MYLDFTVKIPDVRNKITYRRKGDVDYVYYEYDREYDKVTKKTNPKRSTIGKKLESDPTKMVPNENYLKYFSAEDTAESRERAERSCCIRIGAWLIIRRIIEEYKLTDILEKYISKKDLGLVMDLAAYSLITEENAGQYYPDYAYDHPLFTNRMHIYSDSKVSELLSELPAEASVGFLNDWNRDRKKEDKIYISYDSTNKNSQAGDIEIVEYGHPKEDKGLPVFNYSVAYDSENREPLFYEEYPGSVNDVSQLTFMLEKAEGYGYKNIGFILDRGYFSKGNIAAMNKKGYDYVIMVKGMKDLVSKTVLSVKGTFENSWAKHIEPFDVYGTTVKQKLYETDDKASYFHIYHDVALESEERKNLVKQLRRMRKFLKNHENQVITFGSNIEKYFYLHYNEKTGGFQFAEDKCTAIERENELSGYFCLITSEKMTAKEALLLYKGRDASEKLFCADKSYLGNRSLRIYGEEAAESKIFIEFIALIIRNRIYRYLWEKASQMESRPNYMTVPAALKEMEKIEMVRLTDGKYRLDHAVTRVQKTILSAFGMDAALVKHYAEELSRMLMEAK